MEKNMIQDNQNVQNMHNGRKRVKSFLKSLLDKVAYLALLVVVVALVVAGVQHYMGSSVEAKHVEVTTITLEQKLSQIGELATYEYTYKDLGTAENTREIPNPFVEIKIAGTTHKIQMTYDGIIKVGYQVNQIETSVNEANRTIHVKLPKPEVLGNYIDFNTLVVTEENNILNPIQASELQELIAGECARQLEEAEKKGIYNLAEESVKDIIRNLFMDFEYEIVFR